MSAIAFDEVQGDVNRSWGKNPRQRADRARNVCGAVMGDVMNKIPWIVNKLVVEDNTFNDMPVAESSVTFVVGMRRSILKST